MIREATAADIPAVRRLMEGTPGFWQRGWQPPDVVLLRHRRDSV
jgi:hypothetical protein